MKDLRSALLEILNKERNRASISALKEKLGSSDEELESVISNLEGADAIKVDRENLYAVEITEEGRKDVEEGFPEERLLKEFRGRESRKLSDIKEAIALGWAKKNGWVEITKDLVRLTELGKKGAGSYDQHSILASLSEQKDANGIKSTVERGGDVIKNLEKRGLLTLKEYREIVGLSITDTGRKMLSGSVNSGKEIIQLNREMIKDGSWKGKKFKRYDINAGVEERYQARLHPVHKFIDHVRNIWIGMGFTEVKGPIIESAFWNFDALFSPQDHPTRDMQDTFFLSNPKELDIADLELMERVKKMHTDSWKDYWDEEVAKQPLLRTHTTSVSVRHINKFGNLNEEEYPIKLFSLGKVFRNETVDYKHLAELHQSDGIIIGNSLTLSNLVYVLKDFYKALGFNVKFRNSYFPFTEPSLEVYYYDEEKQDNIELCGGGIIRKEITRAMGTGKTVLAWGGGLDRLMFNHIELQTLSDLYKNDIGWLRKVREVKPK